MPLSPKNLQLIGARFKFLIKIEYRQSLFVLG
ncbi:MAG: hypothetical protein ACJAWS_001210 [Oleiphilaceae bacterium]|jgi:hypothetical protein